MREACADRLEPLAKAGANLEMVFARRTPESPGPGHAVRHPDQGREGDEGARRRPAWASRRASTRCASRAATSRASGAKIARALGDGGVSIRGMSAIAMGKKFVSFIACDSADDQARAIAALKKAKL